MRETSFPFELQNDYNMPFAPSKDGDVGHDLYVQFGDKRRSKFDMLVSEIVGEPVAIIWPFSAKLVGSGIRVSQPDKVWCLVTSRSSASKKKLMVLGGVIDSGYQGELFAVLHNFGLMPRMVKQGERYAQVIFFNAVRPSFRRVFGFLTGSNRGDTGFGSSGR